MYAVREQKLQLWLYMWVDGPFFFVFAVEEELTLFWHPVGNSQGRDAWRPEDTRESLARVRGC